MAQTPSNVASDVFNPAHRPNPYPAYRAARQADWIHVLSDRTFLLTRAADCLAVLGDEKWGHGYDDRISPFRPGVGREDVPGSFLGMDPPDHTRLRRVVSKAFTQRRIEALHDRVEQLAAELIDAALDAGDVDLIETIASPLPRIITCEIIGVPPADHPVFSGWTAAIARGVDPDIFLSPEEIDARNAAESAFENYFTQLVDARRRDPQGDLLSDLVAAQESGTLSEHELLEIAVMLMIAGHETTVNALGNALIALHRHPDQLALLRANSDLAPAAVEECLRYDPPAQFTSRVALEARELRGHSFNRGDGVVLMIGSANRDPDAFDDPERFDITRYHGRAPATRHLAFSTGPHHCLGFQLARLEMGATLRALAVRAPRMEVDCDDPTYRRLFTFRGPQTLPARMR